MDGAAAAHDLRALLSDPRTCVEAARSLASLHGSVDVQVALCLLERDDAPAQIAALCLAQGLPLADEALVYLTMLSRPSFRRRAGLRLVEWLRRTNRGGPLFRGAVGHRLRRAAESAPRDEASVVELLARLSPS